MIEIERFVCVSDTDCTKALYFTTLLKYVQEGFEQLLRTKKSPLNESFFLQNIAFPIVHVEGDFYFPIYLGNHLKIKIDLEIFKTSFAVLGEVFHEGKLKGKVFIKHVCLNPKTKEKIDCKKIFHEILVF